MGKDEKGYIVVETIGSFILFLFLAISILSLVNIVTLQARIHSALTQTAKTMSVYAYTLEIMGLAGGTARTATQENIQTVVDGVSSITDLVMGEGWLDEIVSGFTEALIASEVERHLTIVTPASAGEAEQPGGNNTADESLRAGRVVGGLGGLDFSESVVLDENGNIRLTVTYEVYFQFGALPMPFGNLRVTQSVITRAWLRGSGKGYW